MSRICLVLTEPNLAGCRQAIDRYRSTIDLAELRIDLLDPGELPRISRFVSTCGIPIIGTIRRTADGGGWTGTEAQRLSLFRRHIDAGFAFVDLEDGYLPGGLADRFNRVGTRVIRSFHDMSGVPDDLDALFRRLSARRGEMPKIAVRPRGIADAFRLSRLAISRQCETGSIVLGMGSYGFFTRVLAPKIGSYLSFCSAEGAEAAPGHIDPETLVDVYRYRSIDRATRVWGVIGDPVMHSRSPWIHNPAIGATGIDAVYVPFHVDDVSAFLSHSDELDIDAISVTVPHKERMIEALSAIGGSIDRRVEQIGSCNTVYRGGSGRYIGTNTDAPGLLNAVRALCSPDPLPSRALVVGAGGTAQAAVHALREGGVGVMIVNRTAERAIQLARATGSEWVPLDARSVDQMRPFSTLIVQTTSAGMAPQEEEDPLACYPFVGTERVFDAIYAPTETRFLRRAREAGCITMNGSRMLFEQARLQFALFAGMPYPEELIVREGNR